MEDINFDFGEQGLTYVSEIARTHNGAIKIFEVKDEKNYYALKVITKSYFGDQTKVQHVYNEKTALLELNNPGIVKLIKTMKDEHNICFLLELVYACPLHQILKSESKVSVEFARFIGIQLAIILNYIHSQGYIYRDVKASNVMVNQEGRVKLVDLGLSKKISKGRTHSFCGTLHAMSPEFFTSLKEGYGYEIDYYAFGVLLYELVVGHPPFGYENDHNSSDLEKMIKAGVKEEQLNMIADKTLRDLVRGLLDKDKHKRIGHKEGFKDVIHHPFFSPFSPKEVEDFIAGKSLEETSFKDIQSKCDLYLETAYLVGLKPEVPEKEGDDDPFKQFF